MRAFRPLLSATLALALLGAARALAAQGQAEARALWRAGDYDAAADAYASLARAPDAPLSVYRERARVLSDVGRYAEAEAALQEASATVGQGALDRALGEVYVLTGRLDEARAAFQAAIDVAAPDRNVALARLAELEWSTGRREAALETFDSFIDLYNAGRERLGIEELMAVGDAVRYLGNVRQELYNDALLAYDEAAKVDPDDPRPRLLAGELFIQKYRSPDAHAEFDRVLARNPHNPRALLGKARVLDFDGDQGGAITHIRAALETNPRYVGALVQLARQHLELEEHDEALARVDEALAVNPASLDALSLLASVHWVAGDRPAFEEARDRALAINPRYPDLFNTLAELSVDTRKYGDAVTFAERAVALDSTSWWGWGLLGINQLRTGLIEQGRRNVARAFEGDPYNVWLYNTLELTDTFERFETIDTEHFQLFLYGEEAGLLAPLVEAVAEDAFQALGERYGVTPPTPIRVEMFPSSGDFSVRTLGLTGLGALGVSFGNVLVMDSPSARQAGEFNWASVLWHEIAHTFHLAMTDHRVPRWFSEGLAVHEQRVAKARWGHHASVPFLRAYLAGRLHPVSRLNHGFVRPDYPEQVSFSYFQASLVFDMIEDEHGLDAILAMLRGFRDGKDTPTLFGEVLGLEADELDARFDAYVNSRLGPAMAAVVPLAEPIAPGTGVDVLEARARQHPGDFPTRLALGIELFRAERFDDAEEHLRAALRLFPGYAGPDSPYLFLARIHRERGELERAAAALQAMAERTETSLVADLEEAEVRGELGDLAGQARALERTLEAFPYDVEVHETLADVYAALGDHEGVVRARLAILGLDPVDRAQALYRLAVAHHEAGQPSEARTRVLQALELAPSYEDALELLLTLRGGERP